MDSYTVEIIGMAMLLAFGAGWFLRGLCQPTKRYRVVWEDKYFVPAAPSKHPFATKDAQAAFSTRHRSVADAIAAQHDGTVEEFMS